ncbi:hypothetical protein LTR84_007139 [Exophiala bonariae]|uniref:Major facilitator superfamily (MFS) profile domain-containing protein n=1 Tax=Exophiala bonariae TaxID=1690606 RepID=A0AAV9MYK4_9EURO|nr:hypothetical protein LTR84_007139 [Exophiala bonariae]
MAKSDLAPQHVEDFEKREHLSAEGDLHLDIKNTAVVAARDDTHQFEQSTLVDTSAEKHLRRKIDRYVGINVFLIYLCCFLDRVNIGNARLAGLESDLHMKRWDFNTALCMFFVAYILFEFPCTFICKIIGPGWFLPGATFLFGLFTLAMAFVENKGAAYAVRFLLGMAESGMVPSIAYYLSRWYRKNELVVRISFYMVAGPLSGAFGGLLASGILSLDHFGSLKRWRMIFAIEGIITMAIGFIAFFTITNEPHTARWLNQDERALAISRLQNERLAATELIDKWNRTKILRGITSPVQISNMFIFLFVGISVQGIAVFLPTVVATIYPHTSIVHQQLYTVPPYIVGVATVLILPAISTRVHQRQIFLCLTAPVCVAGYAIFLGTSVEQASARYGAIFLLTAAAMPFGIFCNAQAAANAMSDSSRNSAIALANLGGNIGGLIATWTYLPADAPAYRIGAGINLTTSALIFLIATATLLYMKWDNRRREQRDSAAELTGLSQETIQNLEWKHPEFRWSV